jgi:hypothetical protein
MLLVLRGSQDLRTIERGSPRRYYLGYPFPDNEQEHRDGLRQEWQP